ncbi:endonuclease V [Lysobacter capsici]|nr:endonuclease V [Lysobacter capsici]
MILAVDVHYRDTSATVAGVVFAQWDDAQAFASHTVTCDDIANYVPGEFYRRELPCIVQLLDRLAKLDSLKDVAIDCIAIDGYVWLGAEQRPGLGAHLREALHDRVPVVGIAKTCYAGTPAEAEVRRGGSDRPLYVSAAGMALVDARAAVAGMSGSHRIPDLLKQVDRLARGLEEPAAAKSLR